MTCRTARNQMIVYPLDDQPFPEATLPPVYLRREPSREPGLDARIAAWVRIAVIGFGGVCLAALVIFALCIGVSLVARAADYHSNPGLKAWIPAYCCVTNDCCWEISESELKRHDGAKLEVLSTGQVLPYIGHGGRWTWDYSPDGKFYRCACDQDTNGKWIRHQGAETRCLRVRMDAM